MYRFQVDKFMVQLFSPLKGSSSRRFMTP